LQGRQGPEQTDSVVIPEHAIHQPGAGQHPNEKDDREGFGRHYRNRS
jgi:hypothetical protein